jgi:hypothetical protein
VKKFSLAFVLLSVSFILLFSCKKINEATELGGDLIPGVDNVNTFDTSLTTITQNSILTSFIKNDSGHRVAYSDLVALGEINDPEFGQVHANFSFNLSAPAYGSYPFKPRRDSLPAIDSVVLSLRFAGAYGDTLSNGTQTVGVYEIPFTGLGTGISKDSLYRFNDPASDFTGTQIGTSIFTIRTLKDSSRTIVEGYDTFKVANVVRIKLAPSLGIKLVQMDTTDGYKNDSLFRTIFNGLAIKVTNGGNALSYFNLADTATKLVVHYRYNANGKDTARGTVVYRHTVNGQSNYVDVQPGGNWSASLNNSSSDKIYIQSSPSGSYASIVIPGLSSFGNKVIHRAEIIATRVPSASDNIFTTPPRLFLDRISNNTDSSYLFERDLTIGSDGSIGYDVFGGTLKGDTYRFNITRYVQGIVTRGERNDILRLWAPLASYEYSSAIRNYYSLPLPVNNKVAEGRVVLAGGAYPDPSTRLRLRIVYSNQ